MNVGWFGYPRVAVGGYRVAAAVYLFPFGSCLAADSRRALLLFLGLGVRLALYGGRAVLVSAMRVLGRPSAGLSRSLLNFAGGGLPVSAPSRLFYATSATVPSGGARASQGADQVAQVAVRPAPAGSAAPPPSARSPLSVESSGRRTLPIRFSMMFVVRRVRSSDPVRPSRCTVSVRCRGRGGWRVGRRRARRRRPLRVRCETSVLLCRGWRGRPGPGTTRHRLR